MKIKEVIVTRNTRLKNIEPTMMSVPELAKRWGLSRGFLWNRCKDGKMPASKIGERWLVPMWYVEEQEIGSNNFEEESVKKEG